MRTTILLFLTLVPSLLGGTPGELRTGVAQHAFDHLGNVGDLGGVAAACGETVIYCNGVGPGYMGLPEPQTLASNRQASLKYLKGVRKQGVQLAIGYVCATSIVNLNSFDRNWAAEFRTQFHSRPAQWLQVDAQGHPLPSWYGAPYEPACMNNPDWRTFEKFMVRQQLEAGCDGIFFDNPTVHPQGCYCRFCMEKFARFLKRDLSVEAAQQWAQGHPEEFLEFRGGIAADFIDDMRAYARTVKSHALVTCNNSLNTPDVLFSQCRAMGYNIDALSKAEDFVLVEDMVNQARRSPAGKFYEYGGAYKVLHAINHEKPIIAVTVPDGDYHTSANLARLSMAEAAANDATWMLWPGWPQNLRSAMASNIFPEVRLLRENEKLLNNTTPRCDVLLYFPFRQWLKTEHCRAMELATALNAANIQFAAASEDNLSEMVKLHPQVVLVESTNALDEVARRSLGTLPVVDGANESWLGRLRGEIRNPSLELRGSPGVRVVVRDQPGRVIVHLYNLDVERLSSFTDQVHPATNIELTVRVPFKKVRSVSAMTADTDQPVDPPVIVAEPDDREKAVHIIQPMLRVAAVLVLKP